MNIKGFLEGMAEAPEGQMDPSMLPRFKELAEKADEVKSSDILKILDECVYGALCSDFCIVVLDKCWTTLLDREDKTKEQAIAEATWRNEARV